MEFRILAKNVNVPDEGKSTVYLKIDNWNDYSFVTMFHMSLHDESGQYHDIGATKIGFKGQTTSIQTHTKLLGGFESLSDEFFSLGQRVDYYRKMATLPKPFSTVILQALRDIVVQPDLIDGVTREKVFNDSLLRVVSLSIVRGQYARVFQGKAELTDYKFRFSSPESEKLGAVEVRFSVEVNSTPSTNIHAVIGHNGAGKTTLLNAMIDAIAGDKMYGKFFDSQGWQENEISDDYFSSLVSVSFSAFDSFTPPQEQQDPAKGACYFYIGLKVPLQQDRHRTIPDLRGDCAKYLISCFSNPDKTSRWLSAIAKLGSDENFAAMRLDRLETEYKVARSYVADAEQFDSVAFSKAYFELIDPLLSLMSSGHAIVLLTITSLVATVEEKTLVLLDEPESHLHPPLLSAFIRALADLLHDRNGVAIVATHSPVVLQEIPRSCVWKIYRVGKNIETQNPEIETFGENVGLLTSEVFSLEVAQSGFHDLLNKCVQNGHSYEEIVADYKNQLGFEARAILKSLVANRDRNINHDPIK